MINLMHGDCLLEMGKIENKSVDMILCDLPYGTTACKWDVIIPFDTLWKHYERIIKDNGAILLFGTEPFSSFLRISNIKLFRYDFIWKKERGVNFLFANKQPMKVHETISVFYKKQPTYNPQKTIGKVRNRRGKGESSLDFYEALGSTVQRVHGNISDLKFPITVQEFSSISRGLNEHPTQKPVDLLEYFIKTYTNEGETILDNCMGSGSTGVACFNLNRNFIGIENNIDYYWIAKKRIDALIHKSVFGR